MFLFPNLFPFGHEVLQRISYISYTSDTDLQTRYVLDYKNPFTEQYFQKHSF